MDEAACTMGLLALKNYYKRMTSKQDLIGSVPYHIQDRLPITLRTSSSNLHQIRGHRRIYKPVKVDRMMEIATAEETVFKHAPDSDLIDTVYTCENRGNQVIVKLDCCDYQVC